MKYITTLTSFYRKVIPKNTPLGRWSVEKTTEKINNRVDMSNEDHCGPCGQYALTKIQPNIVSIEKITTKKSITTRIIDHNKDCR
jgi:hypothetical protein